LVDQFLYNRYDKEAKMFTDGQFNHYYTNKEGKVLRSVNINNKWRIAIQDNNVDTKWNFLDEKEYDKWEEAFENYI
jgi:hypothetical protein